MSNYTPLRVNTLGSFHNNSGFRINPTAVSYMGSSNQFFNYTFGSIVNLTVVRVLTHCFPIAYDFLGNKLNYQTVDRLLSIGSDVIGALGNSNPPTYIYNYTVKQTIGGTTNTPASPLIMNTVENLKISDKIRFVSGLMGGVNSSALYYIKTNEENRYITVSTSPSGTAVSLSSAKGNMVMRDYAYESRGFFRKIALQAYTDLYAGNGTYNNFCYTFAACNSKKIQMNAPIIATTNSRTFLDGAYSNMNDLITSDITGVNLSTLTWGQDIIASGKAINLAEISSFGNPDSLLRTLYRNNALNSSVSVALLSVGMNNTEIQTIISEMTATPEQQVKLYAAFNLIVGEDLVNTLIPLNCQTKNLNSLADLLNPKKLFPNSYTSLTFPVYNAGPASTNSKTYYLIYTNGGVNIVNNGLGERLNGILPKELAFACDAFSTAMMQIKNIQTMDVQSFGQAVKNLEIVDGLGVNGTNVPTNVPLANQTLSKIARGTGQDNRYTTCDFFGSMTSIHYEWDNLQKMMLQLETMRLHDIYENLYLALTWQEASIKVNYANIQTNPNLPPLYKITGVSVTNAGGGYCREVSNHGTVYAPLPIITLSNGASAVAVVGLDSNNISNFGKVIQVNVIDYGSPSSSIPTGSIQKPPGPGWPGMELIVNNYITDANTEISNILSNNPKVGNECQTLYKQFGEYLEKEQHARLLALPEILSINADNGELSNFVENLSQYASQTQKCEAASVLENIADTSVIGGNYLIASMREARNDLRIGTVGGEMSTNVNSTQPLSLPVVSGTTLKENKTNNPNFMSDYTISSNFSDVPIVTGAATTPGSLAGSPYVSQIPDNLNVLYLPDPDIDAPRIIMPDKAIEQVVICNCDCWDLINEQS